MLNLSTYRFEAGSALGQQHAQVPAKSAGASTADAKADSAAVRLPPHTGIRLALEVVLGSSYDPSGPHALAPVVDALGEDNLEVCAYDTAQTAAYSVVIRSIVDGGIFNVFSTKQ